MKYFPFSLILIFLFFSCNPDQLPKITKNSQFFEINTSKDTVIVGDKGTKIVIPKNTFINTQGELISGYIKLELSEALKINDMILSNLTTTSNGELLETDGMIFINAMSNGEILRINKKKSLYIEIPTQKKIKNMQVYKGVIGDSGDINWVSPKKLEQYLIPIDIDLLNFLPKGLEQEAINYLSFYKNKINKKVIDSLYYSLSLGVEPNRDCGLNSQIQTIESTKFNNTLIATKEFEERLQFIHEICSDEIVQLYVDNLNINLWRIDSLVVEKLKTSVFVETSKRTEKYSTIINGLDLPREREVIDTLGYKDMDRLINKFIDYKNQRLTNVYFKNEYIHLLSDFYNYKLKENIIRVDSLHHEEELQNRKKVELYREILKERKKITMESYGFTLTELGWVNIDKLSISSQSINNTRAINNTRDPNWTYKKIQVEVVNDLKFDQIHSYMVFSDKKSIVKLKTTDFQLFQLNNKNEIPISENSKIHVVVIAYLRDKMFFKMKEVKTNASNIDIQITLNNSNIKEIKKSLKKLNYKENSHNLIVDLELSSQIIHETKNKKKLLEIAFPCCNDFTTKRSIDTDSF